MPSAFAQHPVPPNALRAAAAAACSGVESDQVHLKALLAARACHSVVELESAALAVLKRLARHPTRAEPAFEALLNADRGSWAHNGPFLGLVLGVHVHARAHEKTLPLTLPLAAHTAVFARLLDGLDAVGADWGAPVMAPISVDPSQEARGFP